MTTSLSANRRDVDEVRPFHAPASFYAADPSTADLLHAIVHDLEKLAWLLKSEIGTA